MSYCKLGLGRWVGGWVGYLGLGHNQSGGRDRRADERWVRQARGGWVGRWVGGWVG